MGEQSSAPEVPAENQNLSIYFLQKRAGNTRWVRVRVAVAVTVTVTVRVVARLTVRVKG